MASRWETMVEKVSFRVVINGPQVLSSVDAANLLARQHRDFVRMVKRLRKSQKFPPIMQNSWYQAACDDILTALAKQGGK